MREGYNIVFRGFHECQDGHKVIVVRGKKYRGNWVAGYYWTNECDNHFIRETIDPETYEYVIRDYEVIAETVSQYTGVNDKKDRMIYDKDWVIIPAYGGGKYLTQVYFRKGKFAVDGSNYGYKDLTQTKTEVIGNIFEMPNLKRGEIERK